MAKTALIATNLAGTASTASTTTYYKSAGYLFSQTVETSQDIKFRTAGTLSNFYCRVITNTSSGANTIRTRKNGANGGQSVSIGTAATGVFEDTTNTDSISSTDLIAIQYAQTTTGVTTFTILSTVFESSTASDCVTIEVNGNTTTALSSANATNYIPPGGRLYAQSTEANAKVRIRKAGTYMNLGVYLSSNSKTLSTTWTSRKNGADGNLTVTFTSGTTGWQEDTTHTDSVSAGDDYCTKVVNPNDANSFNFKTQKLELVSTNGDSLQFGSATPAAITDATTRWYQVGGDITNTATEANGKIKPRFDTTASEMILFVTANTINASSTATSRKNGAAGSQTVTITTTATGIFNDTTHTDTITSSDDIGIQYAATSVSGTQTTTISWVGMNFNVPVTTQVNQSFTHLYKIIGRVAQTYTHKYKIIGRIAQTYTHKYKLRQLATQTFTHKYKIIGRVAQTYTHKYKIIGRVAQVFTHKYKLRSLVNQLFTHKYKLRQLATQSFTHKYKLAQLASQVYTHKYKIVGRIAQVFTHLYKIRQLATQTYTHKYKIRQLASSSYTHLYKIVGRVAQQYTHKYNILILATQTYTHKYKIIGRVAQVYTHIYKIVGRVAITSTHKYRILVLASQTFTHKYKIRGLVSQTYTHIYNILSEALHATQSFTHVYKIVGRTSQTYTHKYNIRQLVNQTFTHKYRLKNLATQSFTHLYRIRILATQSFTHKYRLWQLATKAYTFKYVIIGRVANTFTYLYRLRQLTTQPFIHKYKIRTLVSQTHTHIYKLRQLASQQFTHKYAMRQLVTATFTHIYKIIVLLTAVSQTFTHSYKITGRVTQSYTHIYNVAKAFDLIPLYLQSTTKIIESGFNAFKQRTRFRESELYRRALGGKAKRKRATGRVGRNG